MATNYIIIASLGRRNACVQVLLLTALLVGTALLAYDSLLTLFKEVSYIWQNKWKLGTALYLLARYPVQLYIVIEIISILKNFPSLQVCFFHDFHLYT